MERGEPRYLPRSSSSGKTQGEPRAVRSNPIAGEGEARRPLIKQADAEKTGQLLLPPPHELAGPSTD